MEVVVCSTEIIKPSQPTPHHLRRVQLSFIDELSPQFFQPYVFFYPPPTNIPSPPSTTHHHLLKKSLSNTLTRYYPLAGCLKPDFVDCNDEGVPYLVARVSDTSVRQIVEQPDYAKIKKLLPYCDTDDVGEMLLAVQVSDFSCGGLAIAICFKRKFVDGSSFVSFFNSWAAETRGEPATYFPRFDMLPTIFPPRGYIRPELPVPGEEEEEEAKRVGKVFVFRSESLSLLMSKYNAANPHVKHSRVAALCAFIWTRFMVSNHGGDSAAAVEEFGKTSRVIMAVNLRAVKEPALPQNIFGNLGGMTVFVPSMEGNEKDGYGLPTQMRNATKKVYSNNFVKKLQRGDPSAGSEIAGLFGTGVPFTLFNQSIYSFYETTDFGFGKPMWVIPFTQFKENVVILLSDKFGAGVEAVVHLKENQVAKLEADKEFQAYASLKMGSSSLVMSSL